MKKYAILVILLIFMLSACVVQSPNGNLNDNNQTNDNTQENNQNNSNQDNNQNNNNNDNNTDDNNQDNNDNNQDNNDNGDDDGNQDDNGDNNQPSTEKIYNLASPDFTVREITTIDEVTMEDFFNLGNRIDIKVSVSNDELKKLQSDYETGYKSEIYRLASKVEISLTNYGKTFKWEFENVGIRQKGNTSRTDILNGNGGLNLNHYKLSFDETFDDPAMYDSSFISKNGNQEYANREFLGMSGLDFKWDKDESL